MRQKSATQAGGVLWVEEDVIVCVGVCVGMGKLEVE